ncbi:MAG: HD-GYP domain-containing protein, partial [Methanomassiliicoccales archaeon]
MRRIPLEYAKEGMKLGRSIIDSEGQVLLRAGVELEERYLNRLFELGIRNLYIRDELFADTDELEDVISEETRINTVKQVKRSFDQLQQKRKINTPALRKVVNNLLDEILDNSNVLLSLTNISSLDDYIFYHSVSVCTLSIMTGITMSYPQIRLQELGIGAILHDIGKTMLDPALVRHEGELSEDEYLTWRQHTDYGFALLRETSDLSLLSAHVAYQHHERFDGKGYPRGLAGKAIHEYSRIVAVANLYDNLMADRPNRPPYEASQALNLLNRMAGVYFDPEVVQALVANIAIYPVGSIVRLNTGFIGVVLHLNSNNPNRPTVRIFLDSAHHQLFPPKEVDLSRLTTVYIVQVMGEQDLNQLAL